MRENLTMFSLIDMLNYHRRKQLNLYLGDSDPIILIIIIVLERSLERNSKGSLQRF